MRAVGDAIYTGIAWTPFLAVAVFCGTALCTGVAYLEAVTQGTSYFIS